MSRRGNDKNQTILKALLKEQGNNTCADCKTASHPRWASWNLGIFICIRCSGIHRSMGTHISRVKSVDLDTWTDEQVKSMVKWGNYKANQYWEAKLPGGKHTPDDSKIENFIRTKYDLKKWAASPNIPNPSSLGGPANISSVQSATSTQTSNNHHQENTRSVNSNLLDLEFGSPIAAPSSSQSPVIKDSHSAQFSSLPPSSNDPPQNYQKQQQHQQPQQSASIQLQQQFNQPQTNQRDNSRPELKKSILSLYSTPLSASNSTPNFPLHQQQQNYSTSSFTSNNSNTSSLNGLNFNSSAPAFTNQQSSNQWNNSNSSTNNNVTASTNNWTNNQTSNPWSNSQSQTSVRPTYNNNSNQGFEDPFKNVWK